MTTLYVTIGLPGCGKSTLGNAMVNTVVVSSDAIRAELYGDESVQANPRKVFNVVYDRVGKLLREGKDVILDATNLDSKRLRAIEIAYTCGARAVAVVFSTSVETCIERQNLRSRKVPAEVIRRMAQNYIIPTFGEGWEDIVHV